MTIKTKILIPAVIITLSIAAAIMAANIDLFSGYVDTDAHERVDLAARVAAHHLYDLEVKSAAASLSLAENQDIITAIENNDRDNLTFYANEIQKKSDVDFYTITDAKGTVILRTHSLGEHGDSVASRFSIQAALNGKNITAMEEGSVVRLSIRTAMPVFDNQNDIIGVVSAGYRLDTEKYVDSIKEIAGCETTVLLGDERISTTVLGADGKRVTGTQAPANISEIVLDGGNSYKGNVDINGRAAVAHYTPFFGPDGVVIGMLFVGQYVNEIEKTIWTFIWRGFAITSVMLLAAIIIIFIVIERIVKPIRIMTAAASALAVGDTDIDIIVTTNDEMRTLADAFSSMIENTRQQIRIVEHIALNDITATIHPRSEKDIMNRSLDKLNKTIQAQAAAIKEEYERIKIMLDATPLASRLWTRDFKLLECNEAAVKLFRLDNKQNYIDRYFDLLPEYQEDGSVTREKVKRAISEAFENGECAYEWMYQMLDGTPVPTHNTFVRVPYGDDYVVAAYSRDLREHKKMMAEIEQRDSLLRIVNRTASILLNTDNRENIESVLAESMELLGRSVNVDRVHILQNETVDGILHIACKYAWNGDQDRENSFTEDLKFPYGLAPEWESELWKNNCINGPVNTLPPDRQNDFSAIGTKSILIIPVFLQEQFWGLVSFSDCLKERIFDRDEVSILRSASLMMATAVNRSEQDAIIYEANNRTRLLTNATPLGFNLWNRNLRNIETNDTAVKLFGLESRKEYLDRFFELSPEYQSDDSLSKDKVYYYVNLAFEKGFCQFEWMHQKLDGTPIPAEVTLVRLAYGDDYVVAGYIRDMREYKKMFEAIEQRDSLLQAVNMAAEKLLRSETGDNVSALHECMGIMSIAINADRMYIFSNHNENGRLFCTQLCEWSENVPPMQDTNFTVNVAYDTTAPELLKTLLRGECVHSTVAGMPSPDREWLEAQKIQSVLVIPVFIENIFWGFVGFDNCHSEQLFTENEEYVMHSASMLIANALLRNEYTKSIRETSAKLEAALADAKEANKAKSVFLAHMSHEIRTPLNAVIGLSDLTLGEKDLSREASTNLKNIYSAGSTILSIVNDILDISKIESGKFEIYPVNYDTPSLVNDTVTLNIVRIAEKDIVFKLFIDENLPGVLYGDDLRVKQIFNNLLSNAFKYTNSGMVMWRINFERDGDDIWIDSSVQDTGIGIKPEDIQKLFSDYNQVDRNTIRVEGTGLGLAIAQRLAEMMDGIITVESEYGKGSTFHVRLRQKLVSQQPIGKEVARDLMNMRYTLSKHNRSKDLVRVNLSYAHVLVVDDIITNLDVVKGMMKPYEVKIDCATTGRQAIEMIRAENPKYSAVFMDHMMPGMDGIEATNIIRNEIGTEYARTVPVIALTANAIAGNEEMFLSRGFQDFISKPIDMKKLDAVLRRWVRDKAQEKDLPNTDDNVHLAETENTGGGEESALERISIEGVDKHRAWERFGGSESIFIDVLRSYSRNTRPLLNDLRQHLAAENMEDYAILIHGIKGASYGIFAQQAGKSAEELEALSKAGNLEAVKAGHDSFEKAEEILLDNIDRALAEIDSGAGKPLAAAPDKQVLAELKEASAAYDMDRVDRAMAQLESFRYETGGDLVVWLREQVNNMTFEEIFGGEWPSV